MKNKNRIVSLVLSLSITLSVLFVGFAPIVSKAADETIYIGNAKELIEFAKKCSFDAWSIGKTVVLTDDISLEGVDFEPIPSFSGIFDGAGHKISGLKITGAYSPAGLFGYLEVGGEIRNLTVSGVVTPEGDKGYVGGIVGDCSGIISDCEFIGTVIGKADVGGIVGINRTAGSISDCAVSGEIIGENRTGGISGSNEGLISSSVNKASVNTISVNPSLSLSDLNMSLTLDITKLPSFSNSGMTDTGGIAGYCCGIIMGSLNSGRVGYPHIGYNVGGIVGRSSGHLNGNLNDADVFGRKDVGGIVGQTEPHISYDLSEDLLASLKAELDAMSSVIEGATDNAGSSIPTISTRLDTIINNIDSATDALNSLMNDGAELGNGFIGEINRTGEILDEVLSQLSGITADIPTLTTLIESSLRSLDEVLADMEKIGEIGGDAIEDIKGASEDIGAAFGSLGDAISALEEGLKLFEESIKIEDKDAAKASLDKIGDGLSAMVKATDELTSSIKVVTEVMADAKWIDNGLNEIDRLVDIFGRVSEYVSAIYDATTEIKENIDINWSEITEASDELSNTINALAKTVSSLAEALSLMESGIDAISDGLSLVGEAITVNNPAILEDATKQIAEGTRELVSAFGDMSDAVGELSDIIANSDSLTDIFGDASGALGDLSDSASDMSDAMTKLGEGLITLLENIEIDPDKLEEGGALIIAGMQDVSESLGKLGESADTLAESLGSLDKAITAIRSAVLIKDEDKLSDALDSAYEALGGIIDSMEEFAAITSEITDTLKEAKIWGDRLVDDLGVSADALTKISSALVTVQEGVDELRQNISLDLDKMESGLSTVRKGLRQMAEAGAHLENSFSHISDALAKLDEIGMYLPNLTANLRRSIGYLADAMNLLTTMSDKIALLVGYLDHKR